MEAKDFSEAAHEMVKFIINYLESIRERQVLPDVQPGYLRSLVPDSAPDNPENWNEVLADIERVIMPGVTHWQSPRFHAYYPVIQSYPGVLADMLCGGLNIVGISWVASPACTELENVTMDWLGKMLDLPADFLASGSGGKGGGVIQGTASEATLVALLGAKQRIIKWYKVNRPYMSEDHVFSKLVAYCSDQAHCGVERTARISGVKMHVIASDHKRRMSIKGLEDAIRADREAGLVPFYVVGTLGTTSSCVFDEIDKLGDITQKENLWLHIDAAYAGSAFVCPEFRYLMKGLDKADSFDFNPHKWMMVNFDCSTMWVRDHEYLTEALGLDAPYIKSQTNSLPEFRNWQIPFSRRFRSLKLWFTLRLIGVENIRSHIRKHVALAHRFEKLCKDNGRFEIVEEVVLGLVCFKLKGGNDVNRALHAKIHSRGNIFLVPSLFVNGDVFFLRFVVASRFIEAADIDFSFKEVCDCADEVLHEIKNN